MTPEEFKDCLVDLERRRINIRLMERKINKAFETLSSDEYKIVRMAEESGLGDQIPKLRGDLYWTLRKMRKDSKVPYPSDF